MQPLASIPAKNALKQEKSPAFLQDSQNENGADTRIRTGDLILTKDALYLLSYISTLLHQATDIYYHIFVEKARGIFHFFEKFFRCRFKANPRSQA